LRNILILFLVLAVAPGLPSQRKCYKCKGEGWIPCTKKEHRSQRTCGKWKLEHTCTPLFSAACCRGIEKSHCTRCNDPVAEAEILEEHERRKNWVLRYRKWLEPAGVRPIVVETKDFTLYFNISRWTSKTGRYTRNHAAHFFAMRLQQTADKFREILNVLPQQRQRLYMMSSEAENLSVTLNRMGGGYKVPVRMNSTAGQVCTWPVPRQPWDLADDENMHSHVVHMGTHLLHRAAVALHIPHIPWLSSGLAHWMDLELTDQTRDFCIQESSPNDPWDGVDWRKKVYGEVAGNRELPFAKLLGKTSNDQMGYRDHAYAWSFMDFLIRSEIQARYDP